MVNQTKGKPTQEQEQWFWEQCGIKDESYSEDTKCFGIVKFDVWRYPSSSCKTNLPPIDLNNLWQYAVPKLKNPFITMHWREVVWLVTVFHAKEEGKPYQHGSAESEDPALALFWAIYKALGGKE